MSDDYDHFVPQAQFLILYRGEWGAVCREGWDNTDANVVCKQLGYTGANSVATGSLFGPVCGGIWLNNVACDP